MGLISFITIMIIIIGPLFIFSALNPTLEPNPLKGFRVDLGIVVDESNYFKLYSVNRVESITQVNDYSNMTDILST